MRSDRAQNIRTEALNLIRNRKGNTPHIMAVTAEPLPTRLASLALGTGDLDCVYHFALPELREAVEKVGGEDQLEMLLGMINGRRLRDKRTKKTVYVTPYAPGLKISPKKKTVKISGDAVINFSAKTR